MVDDVTQDKQGKYECERSIRLTLEHLATEIVGTRWTRDNLEELLQNNGATGTLDDVDESGLTRDYAFIMGVFEHYGYIDINYLNIPYGDEDIYITEMTVEEE